MSACTKHAAEPVRGYSDCPGCEVESLRQQLAAAQAEIERLQDELIDIKALVDTGGWYLATAANVAEKALAGEGGGE